MVPLWYFKKKKLMLKLGEDIEDIKLMGGYWYALMPGRERDPQEWVKVSDILQKPKFNIKSSDEAGSSLFIV